MSAALLNQSDLDEQAFDHVAERQQHMNAARGIVAGVLLSLPVWCLIGVVISAIAL